MTIAYREVNIKVVECSCEKVIAKEHKNYVYETNIFTSAEIKKYNIKEITMSTSKEYKDFILEQLNLMENITCRPMMWEYLLYYNGVLFGGIFE